VRPPVIALLPAYTFYRRWDIPDSNQFRLRVEQLEFRRHEVYEIYKAFRSCIAGDASDIHLLHGGSFDNSSWRDMVQCDSDVAFTGHSFGGCTVLSVLSSPPPEGHEPLPISQALALDPWFQPLSKPGPMPTSWSPSIPLCMIFSDQFAAWKEGHDEAEKLKKEWPAEASLFVLRTSALAGVTAR